MTKIVTWSVLDVTVLAVAVERIEGRDKEGDLVKFWCAYIKAVPGDSHERELDDVVRFGSKLRESIARAIFPTRFKGVPYAW